MNGICNEMFYEGSITIYPTYEKGNIYFSSKYISDISSDDFLSKYRKFVYKNITAIQGKNANAEFVLFNDKPNIKKICSEIQNVNFVVGNDNRLIDFLNNKHNTRNFLKSVVPILEYKWINLYDISYEEVKGIIDSNKFVVQGETGSGGESTYLIDCKEKYEEIKMKEVEYSVSQYCSNIPFNVTMVIGNYNSVILPVSAQLISLIENKFKYVGGDFIFPQTFKKEIIYKIYDYSKKIGDKIEKLGYRGILGIDYIVDSNDNIYFMEINPRFQSSSFLISKYMEEYFNTNIAELHYQAIRNDVIKQVELFEINNSFINSNNLVEVKEKSSNCIYNGYSKCNRDSFYRKLYDVSLINNACFEKIVQ